MQNNVRPFPCEMKVCYKHCLIVLASRGDKCFVFSKLTTTRLMQQGYNERVWQSGDIEDEIKAKGQGKSLTHTGTRTETPQQ